MADSILRVLVGAWERPEESALAKVLLTAVVSVAIGLGLGDGVVP